MNTISKTNFRVIYLSSVIIGILAAVSDSPSSAERVSPFGHIFMLIVAITGIWSAIATLMLRPIARPLTIIVWVMAMFTPFAFNVPATAPISVSLQETSTLLSGFVLALMYFSNASEWFTKRIKSIPATEVAA